MIGTGIVPGAPEAFPDGPSQPGGGGQIGQSGVGEYSMKWLVGRARTGGGSQREKPAPVLWLIGRRDHSWSGALAGAERLPGLWPDGNSAIIARGSARMSC